MTLMITITSLNLQSDVAQKAQALLTAFPGTVFISGRRTLAEQSAAMAANVLQNRHYIGETYAPTPASARLQAWVDHHPSARSPSEIAAGLLSVFQKMTPAEQESISRHLIGRAFDVQPGSCPVTALEALHPEKLLTHEGSLMRWHVQF